MGEALLELGYSVLGARLDMAQSLLQGDVETALNEAGNYDVLQDVPWAALFKELDSKYPNSKFILTVRDEKSWLVSASNHFKDTDILLHKWLYGKGVLQGNEELYLERYRQHYAAVNDYFSSREGDIITMDLHGGDGWDKLCNFLNEPVPSKRFPYANKARLNYTKKEKLVSRFRSLVPPVLRKARVSILKKLGWHQGLNRFNNYEENKIYTSTINETKTKKHNIK
jgi:hypothetical protein